MRVVESVKVVLKAYDDQQLEFDLVFADNCVKAIKLDSYGIRAWRGIGLRGIIEAYAQNYFDDLNRPNVEIHLVFM